MSVYTITVETNKPIPVESAMKFLTEVVADALETLGLQENGDYEVLTKGPPELHIGVTFR